ncbi:protein NEOXANTHIN-DEFICIENT 1 isoform X2 [Prosopis cineraria]|uniref:protein NEOXANTHIN-DEFICIENT 1 isoform X2 n=1 Tax=Prosopis cineraria TaxID=364024 RepID=UPI00240EA31A|nr:protein NEOXANTHIN-DEFICIENT 1 isoform X2 [Prosopis cineraria]
MESGKANSSSGYGEPPWKFEGSAVYQLHLVKAEKARACIPKEFRLVELFGYTLGGFFLANYEDSPAGVFDELVVIAGIVWNRPTSCAWAARVYVNSDRACDHGRKEVGLPSQMARFSKRITAVTRKNGFWDPIGINASSCNRMEDVQVTEIKGPDLCDISLASAVPALNVKQWMGPTIRMSLPSFSGGTEYNPNLLKYSCQIECRLRVVQPLRVSGATLAVTNDDKKEDVGNVENETPNLSTCVMLSKPILALKFSEMKMQVEAPSVLSGASSAKL